MRCVHVEVAIASLALALVALVVRQPRATATPEATPPSAAQVLGWLNQQRTTNGLPALALDATRSAACAAHNNYMTLNHTITHVEDPSKPGYSAAGAEAGKLSMLANVYWLPPKAGDPSFGDPFENAPFHLAGILTPAIESVGIDQHGGYICISRVALSSDAPGGLVVYPASGTHGWAPFEDDTGEVPSTPEQVLGIGKDTGRHLYVWTTGTWAVHPALRVTSATLTDSAGESIPLRWCDNPTCGWHVSYNSAILIPTVPLKPQTTYTAEANVSTENGPLSKTWSFTTAGSSSSGGGSYTGPACPVRAGLLDASIILARGGGTVNVNCRLIGVKSVTLTATRIVGKLLHHYPPVHLNADLYGGVSVSYRRLLAGQLKIGRYRLLIVPNVGKASSTTFRISRG